MGKKIPKIKKGDRIKVIDELEILVVQPLTHHASIRYGHKSGWCTATSNKNHFENETKNSILIYVILYEIKDGKRGKEKTKIAIHKNKRIKGFKSLNFFDRLNDMFSVELLKVILKEEHYKKIMNFLGVKKEEINKKTKMSNRFFKIGSLVKCNGNKIIRVDYHEYDEKAWEKYLNTARYWSRNPRFKQRYTIFRYVLKIQKKDIIEAEVISKTKVSILVVLKKVDNLNDIEQELLKRFPPIIRLNMTFEKSVELIKKIDDNL